MDDASYTQGTRAVWLKLLRQALNELGYTSPENGANRWVAEREEAIAMLRELCADHGDNDWDEKLHLADIINKHLGRHLK